jgi:nucleoid-associated protein YgaU
MKIKGKSFQLIAVFMILLLVFSIQAFAQEEEKMKLDEYKAELTETQTQEAAAQERITALEGEIDGLEGQLVETQGQIDTAWDEIYALLGTDKAGQEAFMADLEGIEGELDGLAALSPEELFKSREELEALGIRIEEAKGNQLAVLSKNENKLADLDGLVAALKAKMPANIFDQYTVIENDYLWKIAKMEDIYGDAYQWIRIYCVNKDQIKDPDLIYSDQVFNIARGVGMGEHLVVKGEYLSKISSLSKVFNDPTKWTKLYEANKDLIDDPNLIFPYQVLTIPKE